MAGDPFLEKTEELVLELERAGADIVELGVPFSDPIADGPVIQRAGQRSLKWKTSIKDVLTLVRDLRGKTDLPLVLMSYYNPVLRFGEDRFIQEAVSVGLDGVILPDLTPEEGGGFLKGAGSAGLDTVLMLAPTSTPDRIRIVGSLSRGFIYYVSLTGITGAKMADIREIQDRLRRVRRRTSLPFAVGFGVATPKQAGEVASLADGVIVGSAIVRLIEENADRPDLVTIVSRFVQELKEQVMKANGG
jgi:tryptophan synthase alpha chain